MTTFFAPKTTEACGQFTPGHFLAIAICVLLIVTAILLTYKKDINMDSFLKTIGIICLIFEIIKIVWGLSVHRYSNYANYVPLWFCSLFVPASVLAGFCKGKLRHAALCFMYYGGIVGGLAYIIFPATSLFKFPLLHFISIHSMLYHSVMIYTGFMIAYKKILVPKFMDFLPYFAITTLACLLAYLINAKYGTNLMFLSRPSNNAILKKALALYGDYYPLAITLYQNICTFAISMSAYHIIHFIIYRKSEDKK